MSSHKSQVIRFNLGRNRLAYQNLAFQVGGVESRFIVRLWPNPTICYTDFKIFVILSMVSVVDDWGRGSFLFHDIFSCAFSLNLLYTEWRVVCKGILFFLF